MKTDRNVSKDRVKKGHTGGKKLRNTIEKLNQPVRINKFIADSGFCSRRKAEDYILGGAVKINGKLCTELSTKVSGSDKVTINGDPIKDPEKHVYILLNKPKDTISTTNDEKDRTTVTDIVSRQARIYPVGRLDRNTTGALLLTNDGELANRLMHPSYNTEKIYSVKLDRPLDHYHAEKIVAGVQLEEYKTSPCELFIHPDEKSRITITLTEGKNREVRNLFEHFGYRVKQLERKLFAGLSISGMNKGRHRHLKQNEIDMLKKSVGLQ
jgi:23S rRNA pseudouridine2605 synthase